MSVLTKHSEGWTIPAAIFSSSAPIKGTKKEPVGAFHVVRLRRILLCCTWAYPLELAYCRLKRQQESYCIDLPDKKRSLTDPYYCDRVSWMTHHNHVDHLGGVMFETHGTCVRQVYLRGSLNYV